MLEHDDLRRTLRRIAHEIAEKNPSSELLAIVGIHTRGAILARRLHELLGELTGTELPIGDLDISFYRDDAASREPAAQPVVHASHIDFDVSERTVVLVDDVLFTGRTVRAGVDALFDYGRPAGSSWPFSATAAIASCRSAPTTSARTFRPPAGSGSTCGSRRSTESTK